MLKRPEGMSVEMFAIVCHIFDEADICRYRYRIIDQSFSIQELIDSLRDGVTVFFYDNNNDDMVGWFDYYDTLVSLSSHSRLDRIRDRLHKIEELIRAQA